MNSIKKIFFISITLISFISCKGQESEIERRLEVTFKDYIIKSWEKNNSKTEAEHYFNNEMEFILKSRKEFFSNIELIKNTEINLVEFFDKQMPTIYSAILKLGSKLYYFEKNTSFETQFKEVTFDTFKKEHKTMACILLEMDKPTPNQLTRDPAESSYHYSVFITKVNKNNNMIVYIPNDICILVDKK
ncbi:hypothetical protein [uncultured Psychroserpens sp.]|uniref:hypothetical protein n=1 Tax=uncultured Psychroserpens sp. TaxID=255436 RepID=UPI0026085E9A|nr:hypothetical protein [uncultured Psychroserpens sp.]